MNTDIFNRSIYFNIRGTIIELPMNSIPKRCGKLIKEPTENSSTYELLKQSEWCVDYKGTVFKTRRDAYIECIKKFLNSNRESDIVATDCNEAVKYSKLVRECIQKYNASLI